MKVAVVKMAAKWSNLELKRIKERYEAIKAILEQKGKKKAEKMPLMIKDWATGESLLPPSYAVEQALVSLRLVYNLLKGPRLVVVAVGPESTVIDLVQEIKRIFQENHSGTSFSGIGYQISRIQVRKDTYERLLKTESYAERLEKNLTDLLKQNND